MRKIEYIMIAVVVTFFSVVIYNAVTDGNKRRTKFIAEVYMEEVVNVNYENKLNNIELSDGRTISLSMLNSANPDMDKFYGKYFYEFLFPGDSLYKKSGELVLKIVPKTGSTFILDCR